MRHGAKVVRAPGLPDRGLLLGDIDALTCRVLSRLPKIDEILRRPPLLVVEVISPHDEWQRLRTLFDDWMKMGVEHVWALEQEIAIAYRADARGMWRVREAELAVEGTPFRLSLDEVFAAD